MCIHMCEMVMNSMYTDCLLCECVCFYLFSDSPGSVEQMPVLEPSENLLTALLKES